MFTYPRHVSILIFVQENRVLAGARMLSRGLYTMYLAIIFLCLPFLSPFPGDLHLQWATSDKYMHSVHLPLSFGTCISATLRFVTYRPPYASTVNMRFDRLWNMDRLFMIQCKMQSDVMLNIKGFEISLQISVFVFD